LLDEVFRANGYRTFSKITGTKAMFRDCSGKYIAIDRNFANVLEQRKMLRWAAKQGAQVFVVECMALKKSMQEYSERILFADVAVITNVRTDHLEVMGDNKEQMAETLLMMTRKGQKIFLGDAFLAEKFQGDSVITSSNYESIVGEFKENTDLVLTISNQLGLNYEKSLLALKEYGHDRKMSRIVELNGNKIYFGFAINDLESTMAFFEEYCTWKSRLIWFNDRMDRPLRSEMFLQWICEVNPKVVLLTGDLVFKNIRRLKKIGYKGEILHYDQYVGHGKRIFGMGNIRGLEKYFGEINV
jgi:poly-gamma-glutamate synthase PgsB/CapB